MLEVNHLYKSYQTAGGSCPVLRDICLSIQKGEFIAVMGPSGSGKTTLLNCISRFQPSDEGEIFLDRTNLSTLDDQSLARARNKKLGFIFQDYMLLDGLSVFENICVPKIIGGEPYKPMEAKARNLMSMFGIREIANKLPAEISGGQKQRTAVARALMNDPLLILADEPTGNLDSRSGEAVIHAFLEAKEKLDATILMVTHDSFSASYCDRVVIMKDGQIHQELSRTGSRQEFFERLLNVLHDLNTEGTDNGSQTGKETGLLS